MGKFTSVLFLGALALGLSFFTGSRTLDLLAWALPTNQEIYKWLGLAAFEGGMYFWSGYFVWGAKGIPQRSIAIIMAVLSIVAIAVCTIADMNIDAAQQGKVAQLDQTTSQTIIVFIGVIIVLNVAAFVACHLFSIENMRRMKEQDAEDMIYNAGLKAISAIAPGIAADAAPYLAEEWANRTWQKLVPGVPHRTEYIPDANATPQTIQKKAPLLSKARNFFGGNGTSEEVSLPHRGTIDTSQPTSALPRPKTQQKALPRPVSSVAAERKARREQRYTLPVQPVIPPDEKGTVQPPFPATQAVPIKKNQGPYVVNRPLPKMPTND